MFKRRTPRTLLQNIKEAVWPSMGWLRLGKYLLYRLVRLTDTTHKIAAGIATGISMSFSPIIGTHFIQSVIICLIIRANILGAFIGTAIGNPWTIPFIWWSSYQVGKRIAGLFGWQAAYKVPSEHLTFSQFWEMLHHHPMDIVLPWMIGGYLLAAIVWFPAYWIFYAMIKGARTARRRVKLLKARKTAREVTKRKGVK